MKKVIRLTESKLVQIIKKVIEENANMNAESFFRTKYPHVVQMAEYADAKIGSKMNRGIYFWNDNTGNYLSTSSSSSMMPSVDENNVLFSVLNNGTTKIEYTNDYGIDPKPIPFPKTFQEFKKWFDNVGTLGQ